jgi:hypothetical protein
VPFEGPNYASTGTNVSGGGSGTAAWANPGNVAGAPDDLNPATSGLTTLGSRWLQATDYGFAIPGGETINGIQVEIRRFENTGSGDVSDGAVRVVKGGVIGSSGYAGATGGAWPFAAAYDNYGGAALLWSETWTDSDINATNFGAALWATSASTGGASVVSIEITVYYGAGGGSPPASQKRVVYIQRADQPDDPMFGE